MLLGFSGCGIPRLCCPNKAPTLPDTFSGRTDPDSSAHLGVDEFFSDPVLTQLIAQGLSGSQELRIRNQEVRIASNEIWARRGAYLPFVTVGGRGGFDRSSRFTPWGAAEDQLTAPGGRRFPDPLTNARLTSNLFWRIDIWRELRNARDAAQQRYIEAMDDRDYFVTRLVAEIADNYYELASLDKRLVYLDQTIDLQQRSLAVATAQKDAARGTELGVQRFLAEVRKNESQRYIVRQSIVEAENRINVLVGRYPQYVERTAWDYITLDSRALMVGVPAQLLGNRRDIRAAEREIAASGLDVLVARAKFFPRLDLTAGIGYEAFDPKFLFNPGALIAGAAGELVAPLINKRAIQADYRTANARQLQAIYDYQRTVIQAFTEVVNYMNKVDNYRQSVAIKQQQVKALEESVDFAGKLFLRPILEEYARVEYVDVLLAQRDLLEARTALIEAKQQQLSAMVKAYQALGGGLLLPSAGRGFVEFYETLPEGQAEPANAPAPSSEEPRPTKPEAK